MRAREEVHRTLLTLVPDGFDVDALIEATERVTGALASPNTGILFTLPVTRARGLHPRRTPPNPAP